MLRRLLWIAVPLLLTVSCTGSQTCEERCGCDGSREMARCKDRCAGRDPNYADPSGQRDRARDAGDEWGASEGDEGPLPEDGDDAGSDEDDGLIEP